MLVSTIVGPLVARGVRNCVRHNVVTQTGMRYYASQTKNAQVTIKHLLLLVW